jgi:hypothetical protein
VSWNHILPFHKAAIFTHFIIAEGILFRQATSFMSNDIEGVFEPCFEGTINILAGLSDRGNGGV